MSDVITPAGPALDLRTLAAYGDTRGAQVLRDTPEVRLVLFSLQHGQRVSGRGEPRVHLICIDGAGELWAGDTRVPAHAGTVLACEVGEPHGAQAGEGPFLVLGVITPRP